MVTTMDRRHFLRQGVLLGAGSWLLAGSGFPGAEKAPASARVILARTPPPGRSPDRAALAAALDRGLAALTGLPAQEAWKSLFSPHDVVGLKINGLAGRGISTTPALAEVVAAKLMQAGLPANHIMIWDRLNDDLRRAGYSIVTDPSRVRCFGNDTAGYSDRLYESGMICSRLSRVVTEWCSALINMPVLKDHGIVGLSGSMKNYFGAIDNPNKYHGHAGNPFVADVSRLPLLQQKTRLVICDAMTAQYEGGPPYMPQWCWPLQRLILATDVVAHDQMAWQLIEEKRKSAGLPSLKEANREPRYIQSAALAGLGIDDPGRIELLTV